MKLEEAQVILNENGYLMESTEDDMVAQIAKVIGGVYEILKVHEVPITANWLSKEYKIHTSGTSYWVEFRKGLGFEHRGLFYPWRVKIKHPKQLGFAVVAYNMPALKKYFKQAKEIQQNESYKNEIPDDVMDLALEVYNHSCYNLDYDVYQLAEMGEDWLKEELNELNDKEMRIACW